MWNFIFKELLTTSLNFLVAELSVKDLHSMGNRGERDMANVCGKLMCVCIYLVKLFCGTVV
jgi:hypothetical protein